MSLEKEQGYIRLYPDIVGGFDDNEIGMAAHPTLPAVTDPCV